MALQAIRMAIGSDDFFTLIRRWAHRLEHGNATTARFEAMAENVSGQSLDSVFAAWLHTSGKPPGY
jgi:aminopeptidase N